MVSLFCFEFLLPFKSKAYSLTHSNQHFMVRFHFTDEENELGNIRFHAKLMTIKLLG